MKHIAVIFVLALLIGLSGCERKPPAPTTVPASQPATAPTSQPAEVTYVDVVRASYPKLPATQPLGVPVDLVDAGHYRLNEPIYLCPRGDLWITREDAPPLAEVLKKASKEQIHLTQERVRLVQWGNDEEGRPIVRLVVQKAGDTAMPRATTVSATSPATHPATQHAIGDLSDVEWVDGEIRHPITPGRGYRWQEAVPFGDGLAVPTERGVSIFHFAPEYQQLDHDIVAAGEANVPWLTLDASGLLLWSPWDGKKPGGSGADRFVDGKWTHLGPEQKWPEKILHLVPLLDGSVLQLYRDDANGPVKLAMATLDSPIVDEQAIGALVEQLSDDDAEKRDAANAQLTRYGPASWPVLEKLLEDQPPEARIRMQELLRNRIQPTLGGRVPVDGKMTLADRFSDGGILLHLAGGASIPQPDKPPLVVKPAWISIRPGRAIELLEPVLVKDAQPARQRFFAFGDESIVSDAEQGPRRLLGNHVEAMLNKDESKFAEVIGADRRGRWLFRQFGAASTTLVLDPTLPDPTPKLPVWLMFVDKGTVGWNRQNYPCIKRGGAWMLLESGWRPMDEAKDPMTPADPSPAPPPMPEVGPGQQAGRPVMPKFKAAIRPTTAAAPTAIATSQPVGSVAAATSQPAADRPLLVDTNGRRYFDGAQALRIVDRAGKETIWPLPANAVGDGPVTLIQTADGTLFLFNQPGRVVRIKPTPDSPQPFAVEAVFTHRIPNSDTVNRIWLDPAGRIVMAYDRNRLAILFPQGRIPHDLATLIPAKELE